MPDSAKDLKGKVKENTGKHNWIPAIAIGGVVRTQVHNIGGAIANREGDGLAGRFCGVAKRGARVHVRLLRGLFARGAQMNRVAWLLKIAIGGILCRYRQAFLLSDQF